MKRFHLPVLIVVTLITAAPVLAADLGLRAGRYNESNENFVGADLLYDLGAINLNPNIEYSLEDVVTTGSVNLDFTLDVAQFGTARPYVGAGVGLLYVDADAMGTQTELLGNLIGGIRFNLGRLKPYAQVKYFRVIEDADDAGDDLALTIGLRF